MGGERSPFRQRVRHALVGATFYILLGLFFAIGATLLDNNNVTASLAFRMAMSGVSPVAAKVASNTWFEEVRVLPDLHGCVIDKLKATCGAPREVSDAARANGEDAAWCVKVDFIYRLRDQPRADWKQFPRGSVWVVRRRNHWVALPRAIAEERFSERDCPCKR